MRDKGVNIRDIEKKSHPDSRFNSFKISISVLDKKKVYNPRFWPYGVRYRSWREASENSHNFGHPYNIYSDSESDNEVESEIENENIPSDLEDRN